MGVPALFRWLSQKYPKIVSPVIEEHPEEVDGVKIPIDTRGPNPNGEEFDNLYLDMNGIVHPCSHPEDRPPPANETEMMLAVFEYTDRVLNMVRPRKLLMIAVDGVAPRAKLNQQRSRRFRTAQEAKQKDEDKAELLKMLKAQGTEPEDQGDAPKKTWDSNAITPGTPFMNLLAQSLRYWIAYKLNTDPAWKNLKVIISDASVPGEGEHKIMDFIRSQRSSPSHDPNTRHVMYGLDADLIMLGLATHEPYFRILREDVFAQDTKPGVCRLCNQPGHMAAQCKGVPAKKSVEFGEKQDAPPPKPFIWLHVGVLREYLAVEMTVQGEERLFDLERAIDDWIFMCFFVGNDFLPHLPSLDIREQGIDTLINIWRDNFSSLGGYVTKDGQVDLAKAQLILMGLARQEDGIFRKRREIEMKKEGAAKRRKLNEQRSRPSSMQEGSSFTGEGATAARYMGTKKRGEMIPDVNALPTFAPGDAQTRQDPRYVTHDQMVNKANTANKSAAQVLKESLKKKETPSQSQKGALDELMSSVQPADATQAPGKRTADMMEDESSTPGRSTPTNANGQNDSQGSQKDPDAMPEDTVRLWEDGYADRYYEQKFHKSPSDIEFRHQVARDYVEGLAWVLHYYSQGPASWTWYYPHHYAPFAADFVDIDKMDLKFNKGKPVRPYEQLMSVMPAASNHTIPAVFHDLMTDPNSDIVDFYPEDFEVDLNGKKFAWQGVALLPFIDNKRLMDAMNTRYHLLSEDERIRNEPGKEVLIFSTQHKLFDEVSMHFYSKKAGVDKLSINPRLSEGLSGKIERNPDYLPSSSLVYPLEGDEMPSLDEDNSITVSYSFPPTKASHKSVLLPGVKMPPPVLDGADIAQTRQRTQKGFRNDFRNDGGRPRGDYGGPGRTYYPDNGNRNGGGRNQGFAANYPPPPPGFVPPRGAGGVPPPPPGWQPGMPMPTSQGSFPAGGYPPPMQQGGYRGGHQGQGYGGRGHDNRNGHGNGGYNNGGYNNGGYNNGGYNNGGYNGGGGGRRYDH